MLLQRTLVEKVTVNPVGFTVAVRNDQVTASRPARNYPRPFTKKLPAQKGLKITMSNPDALKVCLLLQFL